jgi:uncharacterized protein YrrD
MFYSVRELQGYKLHATDGAIGDVHEIFFDEGEWRVRYFVVDTGGLLGRRKVLISPEAVTGIDRAGRSVSVNLTQQRVKDSPDISCDTPVSRIHEAHLARHYGWSHYWSDGYPIRPGLAYPVGVAYGYPSAMAVPAEPTPTTTSGSNEVDEEVDAALDAREESTLRSSRDVTGYRINATDGDIGHLDDVIIDDANWLIRYLVVDAGRLLAEHKVLMIPEWIEGIHWEDKRVHVNLPRNEVANSPAYEPAERITRDYETSIFEHYKRAPYWEALPQEKQKS